MELVDASILGEREGSALLEISYYNGPGRVEPQYRVVDARGAAFTSEWMERYVATHPHRFVEGLRIELGAHILNEGCYGCAYPGAAHDAAASHDDPDCAVLRLLRSVEDGRHDALGWLEAEYRYSQRKWSQADQDAVTRDMSDGRSARRCVMCADVPGKDGLGNPCEPCRGTGYIVSTVRHGAFAWDEHLNRYLYRARVLGLDTDVGRQALGKYVAVAVGMLDSVVRVYGPLPAPGVPSGEIEVWS